MKSSAQAPVTPSASATAASQTTSNENTAQYQQALNMINQVTPYGTLTYSQDSAGSPGTYGITGYDSSGQAQYGYLPGTAQAPSYTETEQLTPEAQKELELQQQAGTALDQLALQGTGNVANVLSTPENYSNLPSDTPISATSLPGYNASDFQTPTANQEDYTNAENALMDQYKKTLDPQYAQGQSQLEDQLTQQGITEGSDAWNTAMNNFNTQKTNAYQTAMDNAVQGATQTEQAQYGMANQSYQNEVANALNANNTALTNQEALQQSDTQARQQGITEENYLTQLPLNEVTALLGGGQVTSPTFNNNPQESVANTNVAGITQNTFEDQEQQYQTQLQQQNALTGAVFGAAGSALGGWAANW